MATLNQFQERTKRLSRKEISDHLFKIIKNLEQEIIEKNKEQIYEDRSDIYGDAIGFYSEATEKLDSSKKAGDRFNLYDEGDFFKGFYLEIIGDPMNFNFRIFSTDPKTPDLIFPSQYNTIISGEFFGLSDKNLKGIIEKSILPFLLTHSRQVLDV